MDTACTSAGKWSRKLADLKCLTLCLGSVLWHSQIVCAQTAERLGAEVRKYVRVSTPKVILEHVRIIDGTGTESRADQNITIQSGKIADIQRGADQEPSADVTILDLRGYSVIPGIVGMHDHLLFNARPNLQTDGSFDGPMLSVQMSFSAPRLYLANGVTTIRTAGSAAPQTDVNLKQAIETGAVPGPHLDVTGPFLGGPGLHAVVLTGPEDAREKVAYWADRGVTSFKAYVNITRTELQAVVTEAHKRGLKVLGHLCSVTYEEAAEAGIDSLEHGFFVNTQLDPGKQPDKCSDSRGDYTVEHMSAQQAEQLLTTLIKHHVAITSTLPSTAFSVPSLNQDRAGKPPLSAAALAAMATGAREAYFIDRKREQARNRDLTKLLRRDMELERSFVARGGLLMAGSDPVGLFGSVPGFADHREIELLVEAGFTPVQAIQIATLNGATFLGRQDQIGSISIGKNADLVVIKGDPAAHISDIENVEIVFKDGVGYDREKLLDSVKGHYGEF
ncbi:MAG: amidohydrolase family protein [Alphaproteobacteria bacterium]|nr:amidohydrolase family protein [Alphaproteobacteria bacterium]